VQREWYSELKQHGFEDIEDESLRLLKKWTGVSILEQIFSQEPEMPLQSNWPEPNFSREEEFLNHKDFKEICKNLFRHKNNVISGTGMVLIWRSHCDGLSLREIEKLYEIPNATIFRAIRKIKEFMKIMDLDQKQVVITRSYDPQVDNPFIFSTWRNSVWFDTHKDDEVDHVSFRVMTKEIRRVLEKQNAEVRIACLKEDPTHLIGYGVLDNGTIEFVYIKIDYRNQGVATLLTKGFHDIAKPKTRLGAIIAKKKNLILKEKEGRGENDRILEACSE
jgi:hypothetical protein